MFSSFSRHEKVKNLWQGSFFLVGVGGGFGRREEDGRCNTYFPIFLGCFGEGGIFPPSPPTVVGVGGRFSPLNG